MGGHTQLKVPHAVQGGAVEGGEPGHGDGGGGGDGGREGASKRIKSTRPGLSKDQKRLGVLSPEDIFIQISGPGVQKVKLKK